MSFPRLGAQITDGATRFAVFATGVRSCRVGLVSDDGRPTTTHVLEPSGDGLFAATVPGVGHGTLYRLWLDDRDYPDPYAQFLPYGVNGPAMAVEARHPWQHGPGVELPASARVIYELHVGTFTPEGTFAAATERLLYLADLGVTVIELLPVSAFAGRWGWGYDGVAHFAPHAPYGTPDDLRHFASRRGPWVGSGSDAGRRLQPLRAGGQLSLGLQPGVLHQGHSDRLGRRAQLQPSSHAELCSRQRPQLAHRLPLLDGLRLDATHAIKDPSSTHILEELATLAQEASRRRSS